MKLNVLLELNQADSLYAPCFQSLQEGIHHQWADFVRIFLVRPASLVEGITFSQLSRLRELEVLVSDHYSGAVLVDWSVVDAVYQVSQIYPDCPATYLSLDQVIGIESVQYLLRNLWGECLDTVYLSPVAAPVPYRSAFKLSHKFYSAMDDRLDVNVFALLRDLALGTFNLVWPGNLFEKVRKQMRHLLKDSDVGHPDSFVLTQLLFLGERVRLADLSVAVTPFDCAASISVFGLCEKDEIIRLFSMVRDSMDKALPRFVFSVLISSISSLPVNIYRNLRGTAKELSSFRHLYESIKSGLIHNFLPSLPEPISAENSSSDFRSILHHGYFQIHRLSSSYACNPHAVTYSGEHLSSLLNPLLADSLNQGLELLPLSESIAQPRRRLDISLVDSALNQQSWFCLAEADVDSVDSHSARFAISASGDSLLVLKWVASPGYLHDLMVVIPARCAGDEISVNFNLKHGHSTVVSGEPVSFEMRELLDGVWQLEIKAKVVHDYVGPVQLQVRRNHDSSYQPNGSASIHFSCVEYAVVSSDTEIPCSSLINTFETYRATITTLELDALPRLPEILDWFRFSSTSTPSLCVEFTAEKPGLCRLELITSRLSALVLSNVVDITLPTLPCPCPVRESVTASDSSLLEVRNSAVYARAGLNRLRLDFTVRNSPNELTGFARRLILSRLSLDVCSYPLACDTPAQPSGSASGGSPMLSVISVAYGMHEFVPGWLRNYSLQSIHGIGVNATEFLLADVELSLPLLIYACSFASLTGLRIRVVPFLADPGLYECWNQLIRCSRAKYISNFNPDDRKLPDHLLALCFILEQTGAQVAASSCHVLRFQHGDSIPVEPSEILAQQEKWWAGSGDVSCISRLSTSRLFREPSPGDYKPNNMLHSMPVWRRSLHRQYGFFDEVLHGTYADYAFWISVLFGGEEGLFVSIPLYLFSVITDSHNRVNANPSALSGLIESARMSC